MMKFFNGWTKWDSLSTMVVLIISTLVEIGLVSLIDWIGGLI